MKVAWHDVPGNAAHRDASRRERYDGFVSECVHLLHHVAGFLGHLSSRMKAVRVPNISYRSPRDGFDNRRFPGISCQDFGELSRVATIMPSFRDSVGVTLLRN